MVSQRTETPVAGRLQLARGRHRPGLAVPKYVTSRQNAEWRPVLERTL